MFIRQKRFRRKHMTTPFTFGYFSLFWMIYFHIRTHYLYILCGHLAFIFPVFTNSTTAVVASILCFFIYDLTAFSAPFVNRICKGSPMSCHYTALYIYTTLHSTITLSDTAIRYPLDKDQYGRAMWQIIHSYSSSMPDKLSRVDKIKFRQTLADLVDHLPCQDCKHHARAYLKENKPAYKSNQEMFQYYCDFHNHINESTGKPKQDCQALWSSRAEPCTNCSTIASDSIQKNNPADKSSNEETDRKSDPIPQLGAPQPMLSLISEEKQHTPNTSHPTPNEADNRPKQSVTVNQILDQSLKTSLSDYKNVSTKMFETMCRNAGAPMPELVFAEKTECSNPESSCTHFPIDKQSGRLADGAPTRVYLNINQYSPRSVIHEALHYIAKFKGLDVLAPSHEEEITRHARDIMARDFPMDRARDLIPGKTGAGTPHGGSNPPVPLQELKDEGAPTPASIDPYKNFKERSRKRLDGFTSNLPYYSKYYHGAKKHKREQPSQAVVSTMTYSDGRPVYPQVPIQTEPEKPPEPASSSEGFLSMLDPVFAPFADLLGMPARDVNIAHTPNILANGGIVLVESNVNKFGAMAISLLSSLATLAAGTLTKDSIGLTDKKLLVGMGGALFWNGALRYITNPKISEEVIHHAMLFGNSLATMDVNAMVASVVNEKPKEVEKGMGKRGAPVRESLNRNLSSPVGGQERLVRRGGGSQEMNLDDLTGDLYSDPDQTISNQGTFGKPSWFPSM
jgi:hypothetical protein